MTRPGDEAPAEKRDGPRGTKLPPRVERRVRLSRALLFWEEFLPAIWPAAAVAGLFSAFALFGLFANLALPLHWALLAGTGALIVWLLWQGFRGFRWPGRDEALRHLERSSGLAHAPLSAYEDVAAENTGDPALWAAHRRWISERMARLRLGLPVSALALRDPYALRAAVALLLVVGIAGTGTGRLDRLGDALLPGAAGARMANIEAWVTPPGYTGKPPLYLERGADETGGLAQIEAPEGSKLSIRVHGLKNPPVLESHGAGRHQPQTLETVSADNYSIDATLEETAEVALTEGGRMIRAWHVDVTPDEAPEIALTKPVSRAASGALHFNYRVKDDYGVARAEALIALDRTGLAPPDPAIDVPQPRVSAPEVRLSLPGSRPRDGEGETFAELTAHPWAGLAVTIALVATDDMKQKGEAEPLSMILPAREFTDPLARAIVEQRRRLALDPRSGASVARFIDNFTQDGERYIEDKVVYLSLRAAYWRLTEATRDTDLTGIFDLLWSVALRIEDGDLSLAERDLRDARKALADALAEGAGNEEIDRLMEALKDAFGRYMEAVAELQPAEDTLLLSEFPDSEMQTIERGELEAMMEAIGELAQSGAREQAQAMLDRLQSILENLQMPGERGPANPADKAMAQAIDDLGQMIGKQRDLMDRTFRELELLRLDEEADKKLGLDTGEEPLEELSEEQQKLNEEFDKIISLMKEKGAEPPEALIEAGQAMADAKDRLDAGRADRATASQGQAIQNMQKGAQALADKLMQGGAAGSSTQRAPGTDPLGRSGYANPSDRTGTAVPDRIDTQRAQRILKELRERAMELGRPQIELDYLDRLLKRF
ncbi:MAG: TIGR02302 family protein [Parvibaculum sp.]|uniref:TIGR02302 family protein n=1 Tax=Parvibaculum sp. TaxID=2024848 RepID=UPI002ABBE691|nr:TIGR02302 family protein [Parvibaculum sp.]MDZ4382441.1 TIGR02302 family protein [Parvibaculum sp.]